MRSSLTLHELEAFLAVAGTLNFRQAAEQFHMTQPALSRLVRAAEEKLGTRLFDRSTRRVALSPSGQELFPIAHRIVSEFHGSLSDLSEFIAGRRGHLTIACLPSAAAALLPDAMAAFERSHPRVTMTLQLDSDEFVQQRVADGRADFGLSVAPGPQDLDFDPFTRDAFVLICHRTDAWARRRRLPWRALAQRPVVVSGSASSIRPLVERAMAGVGQRVLPKYEVTHISVVGAMVSAGLGVAPIPRLALRLMDMRDLAVVPLVEPPVHREIGILTRRGRSLSAAAKSFLQTLERHRPPAEDALGLDA